MTRFILVFVLVFCFFPLSAQKKVNDYKYILVPEQYGFLNEANQYQLNALTKFLFKKYGFTAYIEGEEVPKDLQDNGCLALQADLMRDSGLFLTKLKVVLKNCSGSVVYTSMEGTSKEKEYKRAYQEALREAFKSMEQLNYNYQPGNESSPNTGITKKETSTTKKNDAPEEVVVQAVPSIPTNEALLKEYSFNGDTFKIVPKPFGYSMVILKEKNTNEIAKLYQTSRENDFLVIGEEYTGSGFFDTYGNFILHRINPVTQKLITDTFGRQ
ncbi:hypothetical protein [Aquimarina brevivitae]|uniref:Uncharacterized protein n=1 Tax=Aquimarina brevivitae TaxID=323412 RepID=A0A4Q7PHA9_9FLAO|nr:hypothetical protein [Aquimarina brevivitae]RZS99936.1 hypothetical protein EV197_1167 [Aquimarina brevivitae]